MRILLKNLSASCQERSSSLKCFRMTKPIYLAQLKILGLTQTLASAVVIDINKK